MLSQRLPLEVAQHIVQMGASRDIQAIARGMMVRVQREPRATLGFSRVGGLEDVWVYDYHRDLVDALIEWARSWRPGVYVVGLNCSYPDGCVSELGSEHIAVTPSGAHTNLRDWRMSLKAFLTHHGTPKYKLTLQQL